MKQVKKVMAVIFAVVLALSMTVTASAAGGTGTITIQNGGKDLAEIEFSAYKLFDVTVDDGDGSTKTTIDDDFIEFFTGKNKTTDADAYNYVLSASLVELRTELSTYITDKSITKDGNSTGTGNTDVVIGNLPYGYYIIIPNNDTFSPNLALLDSSNKYVVSKAAEPTVDKEANGEDNTAAQVGDTVSFTVYSFVPDMGDNTEYYFKITDTMSKGLTLTEGNKPGNVRVYIGGNVIDTKKYKADSNTDTETGETTLTVEINDFIDYKEDAGKTIAITYSAKLNENAFERNVENNSVFAQYGNDPKFEGEGTKTTNTDVVYIYNFNIIITNTDNSENKKPIGGGIFKITGPKGELKFSYNETGKYYYVDEEKGNINITLPDSGDNIGTITIRGLDEGTYTVTQVTPPDDYPYLVTPKDVVIEFTVGEFDNPEDKNQIVEKTANFINDKGPGLPSTGGMGTVIFTVAGLALIAAVAGSFIISRRKKNS